MRDGEGMISKELEIIIEATIRDARIRGQEYLTVEHLLLALLHDQWGRDIITQCGGNISRIQSALEDFLEKNVPKISKKGDNQPQATVGFRRLLQRAFDQVQAAGKQEVDVGDLLAAIFLEEDSHAVYFLRSEGITRLD